MQERDKIIQTIPSLKLDIVDAIPVGYITSISDSKMTNAFKGIEMNIDKFHVSTSTSSSTNKKAITELSHSRWRASIISKSISLFTDNPDYADEGVREGIHTAYGAPESSNAPQSSNAPPGAASNKSKKEIAVKCSMYDCFNFYMKKPNQRALGDGFVSCTCCQRDPVLVCSHINCKWRLAVHIEKSKALRIPELYKPPKL